MTVISEFDQDTINYLKALGINKAHIDRVHMLAVRAAKLEADAASEPEPWASKGNPLPTLCVVGDDKGERICIEHDYKWQASSRFCNHIYNEPWVLKLVDYIDALEAQRAAGVGTLEDGVQLMGSLMQQSQRDLAFTTNAIIAHHERTIEDLRRILFTLRDVINEASVIDRKTEGRLTYPLALIDVQWELVARAGRTP